MKKLIRFLIIPVIMFLAVYCYFIFGNKIGNDATRESVKYISEHMNNSGKIIDYYDQIGVKSVDDIKLFVKDENVEIEFGKVDMTWTLEEFVSPENQALLKTIGIQIYKDVDTGKLRVFYKDEELERWVS